MITLKIQYQSSENFQALLLSYRKDQSAIIRSMFNRLQEGLSSNEARHTIKEMNNITIDSWWGRSGLTDALTLYSSVKDKKVIFGGKNNLKRYLRKLITKEEYKAKRLHPLVSIGEALQTGNRKFRLDITNNTINFQDKRGAVNHKLTIQPQFRDRLKQLLYIEDQTRNKKKPLTVKIDDKYIYLTFEPQQEVAHKTIENRILAIDTNPNSIGWSVCDIVNEEPVVIASGIIDLKELNKRDKNKKHYETYQVSEFLVNKAIHYQCASFAVEDLNIKSKDNHKGKAFNKLINNDWLRSKLFSNLNKRCYIHNIKFIEVNPAYTSIIGGTLHAKVPDPIAPTLEIARRAMFKYQKGKFYPKLPSIDYLNEQWKQTLSKSFESWVELAEWLKNVKYSYRVSLESFDYNVLRFKSKRSCIKCNCLYI